MAYKGPQKYSVEDFYGHPRGEILGDEIGSFLDNMDAAGIDYARVLTEFSIEVKRRQEQKEG